MLTAAQAVFHKRGGDLRFHEAVRRRFEVGHCVSASSGRAALSLTLRAMRDLRPARDEVCLPAYTSFSVPSAVVNAGLKVSLYDVDPETLGPDLVSLERAISTRTLCIVVCHLYGYVADVEEVSLAARRVGCFVVDDAAQAMGAKIRGRWAGTMGDAGLFSLSRGKNITAVEGGVVVTDSLELAQALIRIELGHKSLKEDLATVVRAGALFALLPPRLYWIPQRLPGLKMGVSIFNPRFESRRLGKVQAALALRALDRLEEINRGRIRTAARLMQALAPLSQIKISRPLDGTQSVFLRLPVRCEEGNYSGAPELGVVRSYPCPLSEIEGLRPHLRGPKESFSGAKTMAKEIWTVPTHGYVTDCDIDRTVRLFRGAS
ncbi:MAG: DegT/DnrJ/EryC1/StrS family aminotransferase [Proteobacteria bacterium]|nr:DegT/DnrJ/EryC1/StrS family aminotransferase [Pseudomonadota bacterium]